MRGLAFLKQNEQFFERILGTTSLLSTYASQDVLPVLLKTGRLTNEYGPRLQQTGKTLGPIMAKADSYDQFLSRNYRSAIALGQMHEGMRRGITPESLGWNPAERVPMNQLAYAIVLYSFAWQPIESAMLAGQVKPDQQQNEIDDYLHLWSVLGYAMGVKEELLPRTLAGTKTTVAMLRKQQYYSAENPAPEGLKVLLRNQVTMMTRDGNRKQAAAILAKLLQLSPGLTAALGLGADPAAALEGL